jgi:hypothetical protein
LAAKSFLIPVYGNFLHHAVEMYLKAALVGTLTVKDMKKHGHDLPAFWNELKVKEKDARLSRFDATIDALHKFETIRFPDEIVARGLLSGVGWAPEHATTFSGSMQPPPKYEVHINLVDELVIELLQRSDLNPKFFVARFIGHSQKREALSYQNPQGALAGVVFGRWVTPEDTERDPVRLALLN